MDKSESGMEARKKWWAGREYLDEELRRLTLTMEEEWIGAQKELLFGGIDGFGGAGERSGAVSSSKEGKKKASKKKAAAGGGGDDDTTGAGAAAGPIVLILDQSLQTLPWESLPCLSTRSQA